MFIFSSFWSNISSYLITSFDFTQFDVGIFSLTGIAGASSAYFASGILKKINYNNKILYIFLMISLLIMAVYSTFLLVAIAGTILIDAFIQLLHVNNQRYLYTSYKGKESQVASSYMTFFCYRWCFRWASYIIYIPALRMVIYIAPLFNSIFTFINLNIKGK
ncbi:hypothetical protein DOE63_00290 [Salmonella enterica subsp. diarizonae serovar 59:z10:-]|nr:hypothetical protein DOE63_00290 [Salmonella enterica subsp. diarizonae serovar 59:z10:-]